MISDGEGMTVRGQPGYVHVQICTSYFQKNFFLLGLDFPHPVGIIHWGRFPLHSLVVTFC